MASIGGFNFITLQGAMQPAKYTLAEITRPGVAGAAFRLTGYKAQPTTLVGVVDLLTAAAVGSYKIAYGALCGSLVSVTDDLGNTWNNVLVLSAIPVRERRVLRAVGGLTPGAGYVLWSEWVLQDMNVAY